MTSPRQRFGKRLGLALVLLSSAQVSASSGVSEPAYRPPVAPTPRIQPAPQYIRERVNQLGRSFNGRVGIAVRSVDDGWSTGWKADELYPQQSVSKLWVSITALDAVDRGRVRLNDRVTLDRGDLTLFHQPIAAKILGGGYTKT